MGGQIVDATLVAAPQQRNTETEKAVVKEGKSAAKIWPDEPAKARQKDTDKRWTVKFARARPPAEGKPLPDFAISASATKAAFRSVRLPLHPQGQDNGRCALRRAHAARRGDQRQHRLEYPGAP